LNGSLPVPQQSYMIPLPFAYMCYSASTVPQSTRSGFQCSPNS